MNMNATKNKAGRYEILVSESGMSWCWMILDAEGKRSADGYSLSPAVARMDARDKVAEFVKLDKVK